MVRGLREPFGLRPPAEDYQEFQMGPNFCYEAIDGFTLGGKFGRLCLSPRSTALEIKWTVSYETSYHS